MKKKKKIKPKRKVDIRCVNTHVCLYVSLYIYMYIRCKVILKIILS